MKCARQMILRLAYGARGQQLDVVAAVDGVVEERRVRDERDLERDPGDDADDVADEILCLRAVATAAAAAGGRCCCLTRRGHCRDAASDSSSNERRGPLANAAVADEAGDGAGARLAAGVVNVVDVEVFGRGGVVRDRVIYGQEVASDPSLSSSSG